MRCKSSFLFKIFTFVLLNYFTSGVLLQPLKRCFTGQQDLSILDEPEVPRNKHRKYFKALEKRNKGFF